MATKELNLKIKQILEGGNVIKNLNKEIKQTQSELAKLQLQGKQGTTEWSNQTKVLQGLTSTKQKLNSEIRNLTPNINSASNSFKNFTINAQTLTHGLLTAGLVEFTRQLYNLSLQSAKFEVLSDNFRGSAEDIEAFRIATANTVTDASLIKLSNQASDLGIGLKEQTILFSLAEDASDKYGISVEEGFQKVVNATEGSTKGLKSLGIQKEVYESIVKDLVKAQGKNIDQLDAESQKQIKLQSIIKASGVTYDEATNKVKDSADKHEALWVIVGNLADRFGGELVNSISGVGTAWEALNFILDGWNDAIEIGIPLVDQLSNNILDFTNDIPFIGGQLQILKSGFDELFGTTSNGANKTIKLPNVSLDYLKQFSTGNITQDINNLAYALNTTNEEAKKLLKSLGVGFAKDPFNDPANFSKITVEQPDRNGSPKVSVNGERREDLDNVAMNYKINEMAYIALQNVIDISSLKAKTITDEVLFIQERTIDNAERIRETIDALRNSAQGFETVFGLLSDWTGDGENSVSLFFKSIEESFGILQQMITFLEAIRTISESIKTIEIGTASKAGSDGNIFESLFSLFGLFLADGGLVKGAGTGRSDSIPARLSNGEYVVNAKATKEYYPLLDLINSGSKNLGIGFANGGLVNIPQRTETPIYITANMDGITFLRENFQKYKGWKQSIRI